jgi:hypothetical protein
MKNIILIFALIFSGQVFADSYKVCVPDLGGCLIAGGTGIWLDSNLFAMTDAATKKEYQQIGYSIGELTPRVESIISPGIKNTITMSSAEARELVGGLRGDFVESALGCFGGVLGCSAGSLAVPEMPLLFWMVKAGCVTVGGQCSYSLQKYYKWQNKKKELKDEEAKAQVHTIPTSGESPAGPTAHGSVKGPHKTGLKCHTIPGTVVIAAGHSSFTPPMEVCLPSSQ